MTTSYDPTSPLPPDDVLTAGLADLPALEWEDAPVEQVGRKLRLTRASDIEPEPVVWAWLDENEGRIPAGALSVAAGREGTGKSSFGMWMAAQITRGLLPGNYYGRPRAVFYVAVEDSWKQTIVPRLIGACRGPRPCVPGRGRRSRVRRDHAQPAPGQQPHGTGHPGP